MQPFAGLFSEVVWVLEAPKEEEEEALVLVREVPFQLEASWEVTLESEAIPSLGGVALGQILPWEEGVVEEV